MILCVHFRLPARLYLLHYLGKNDVLMTTEYGDDLGKRAGVLPFDQEGACRVRSVKKSWS